MIIESMFLNVPMTATAMVVPMCIVIAIFSVFIGGMMSDTRDKVIRKVSQFLLCIASVSAAMALGAGVLYWTGFSERSQGDAIRADFMEQLDEAGFERVELVKPVNVSDNSSLKVLVGTLDDEYVRCVLIDESDTQVRLDCG